MNHINRKVLGTVCLVIASFLNPFGFDILVYKLTQLTSDYWSTMYVLYAFALLFFGFSFVAFKVGKKALGNIFVTIAMFLNPLGYDVIVFSITKLTHDYWTTMRIMYGLTGIFFSGFLYLYKINPIKALSNRVKITHAKIKTNLSKNG